MHMVNKKIADFSLSACLVILVMVKLMYHVQGVPRWRFSMICKLLIVKRTYLDPKLSMHEVWPSYSRDLRLPSYTSSSIYSIFVHFNLNYLKMLMIGAMRAES